MTIFVRLNASAALILLLIVGGGPVWADGPADIKGITLSTHRGGRELGDPSVLAPTYKAIEKTGANWIAVHPYARIRKDGTVSFRLSEGEPPPYWTEPIRVAHEMGMKVCIKPHLAHWRSGFSWRGEIAFETPEEWNRFWEGYSAWIIAMADACRDTDLFVVGTELDLTVGHEDAWRSLIKQVRARTNAPITFASNWDAFERVPFWDALDYVGIQAYFPISRAAHPSERDLEEGWEGLVRRLRAYSLNVQKPIVLTELGYNQSEKAASEPWSYQVHDGMEDLQARCMSIALNAIASEPSIVGSFLWKWFPEPRPVGRNFQLATPKMQSAIKEIWGTEREGSGRDVEGEPGD